MKFKVAPLSDHDAQDMITGIKGYKLLSGARGRMPHDIDSIKNCIFRLSQLAIDFPQIKELDINPIMVYEKGQGCVVTDAKIMF